MQIISVAVACCVLALLAAAPVAGISAQAVQCPANDGWTKLNRPIGVSPRLSKTFPDRILRIAPSWRHSAELFATGYGGLYHSNDCGTSWTSVNTDVPGLPTYPGSHTADIVVDSSGNIIVGFYKAPTEIGENYGQTWRLPVINGGEGSHSEGLFSSYLFSSGDSEVRYAIGRESLDAMYAWIYMSSDHGQSWSPSSMPVHAFMAADNHDTGKIYVASDFYVFATSAEGKELQQIGEFSTNHEAGLSARDIAVANIDGTMYVLTENMTVFSSDDRGSSWSEVSARPIGSRITDRVDPRLSVSPVEQHVLFVTGIDGDGWVYRGTSGQ